MEGLTNLLDRLVAKLHGWVETAVVMLPNFAIAIVVVLFGVFVAKWVRKAVHGLLFRTTHNEPISELLAAVARVVVILVATFVALGLLQLDKTVTSLLAGVGVVGLALGFAFQDIAANFMSGFMMAMRRPFDVGDQVEIGGHHGRILRVEMRATELETLDGLNVTIPNKDVFQNPIINYTQTPKRRVRPRGRHGVRRRHGKGAPRDPRGDRQHAAARHQTRARGLLHGVWRQLDQLDGADLAHRIQGARVPARAVRGDDRDQEGLRS